MRCPSHSSLDLFPAMRFFGYSFNLGCKRGLKFFKLLSSVTNSHETKRIVCTCFELCSGSEHNQWSKLDFENDSSIQSTHVVSSANRDASSFPIGRTPSPCSPQPFPAAAAATVVATPVPRQAEPSVAPLATSHTPDVEIASRKDSHKKNGSSSSDVSAARNMKSQTIAQRDAEAPEQPLPAQHSASRINAVDGALAPVVNVPSRSTARTVGASSDSMEMQGRVQQKMPTPQQQSKHAPVEKPHVEESGVRDPSDSANMHVAHAYGPSSIGPASTAADACMQMQDKDSTEASGSITAGAAHDS